MIVALVPILGHRLGGEGATLSGYFRKREYHFRQSGSYLKQNNDSKH
jgi:hypothetical protein